jgi:hypothetical protein
MSNVILFSFSGIDEGAAGICQRLLDRVLSVPHWPREKRRLQDEAALPLVAQLVRDVRDVVGTSRKPIGRFLA